MKKKLLLVGYSGHKNFGDDLLLFQAYEIFKNEFSLSIWTNVVNYESNYLDKWFDEAFIERKSKLDFYTLSKYDLVVYFGGGIFFDYKRKYSFPYYIRKILSTIKNVYLARLYKTKFVAIGIGLGPFLTKRALKVTRNFLRNFDLLAVRDHNSFKLTQGIIKPEKIFKGYDLSFFHKKYFEFNSNPNEPIENSILICPRKFPHGEKGDIYHDRLIKWALNQQKKGKKIVVFGFQSNHDESILEEYKSANLETKIWLPNEMKIIDVFLLFSKFQIVISARMHGIYVAGMVGRPSIGINVHPKVADATKMFNNSTKLSKKFTCIELSLVCADLLKNKKLSTDLSKYVDSATHMYELVINLGKNK